MSDKPKLILGRTENQYWVDLGSGDHDASLRESVASDGTMEVRGQYFLEFYASPRYLVQEFSTRAAALAWLVEQHALRQAAAA